MAVGVLALQGGFDAHLSALEDIGIDGCAVRYPRELDALDGLIMPGGESTTQLDLIERLALRPALDALFARKVPVLATCAGLILVARKVSPAQPSLAWLDVDVCRNGYGRQLDSFTGEDDEKRMPLVFIRAPRVTQVDPTVNVIAHHRGEPVLMQQGHVVGATFHPELTEDRTLHRLCFSSPPLRADHPWLRPRSKESRVLQHVEEEVAHLAEHRGG